MAVHQMIDEIASEICDNYCKYPQEVQNKYLRGEINETEKEDYMMEHYCNKCPLTEKL